MRAVLCLVIVGLVAAPAAACPRGTACLARLAGARVGGDELPRRLVDRPAVGDLRRAFPQTLRVEPQVSRELSTVIHEAPAAPAMPWIWQVLRDQVYARLPRYDQPQQFSMVLSPVVVAGSFDTVPGFGLAGDF
jgi:hypothetical protein